MTIEQVGLENLPNAYVKEIVLSNKFSPSFGASDAFNSSVSVVVSDYEQLNGLLAWFDYELLAKYLRVIVVQSASTQFSSVVTDGTVELNPAIFTKLSSYNPDQVVYQTSKLKITNSKPEEFDIVAEDTKLFNFENQFNFEAPMNTQDLTYFAAVYVDLQDISNELNLDFNNMKIQSYHGAVTSENVLTAGSIQQVSTLFRRSSGEIYAGPVHQHPELGYMVGSEHTDQPHDLLTTETIKNLKIKDKRKKLNNNKEASPEQIENPYFSDLYTSFDVDGVPSSFFTLNIKSLFVNKTEYGATLLQLDESLFDSILKRFKIEFLSIDRHQIEAGFLSNTLATPKYRTRLVKTRDNILKTKDDGQFLLRSNVRVETRSTHLDVPMAEYDKNKYVDFNEVSKIQEVFVDENFNLRHFEFDDLGLNKNSNGVYRYQVSMLLRDPTLGYVVELRDELRAGYAELESYYVRASVVKNKRTDIKGMTGDFIEQEYDTYSDNLAAAPWISPVEIYVKFLSYIEDVSEQDKVNLKNSLFAQLDPRSTSDSYINDFVNTYLKFMTKFDNFFILSGDRLYDSQKLISNTNNFSKDMIEVSHTFEAPIQPNLNGSQVDFIGQERDQPGLLKVDREYYSALGNAQINKMVTDAGSLTDANFADLDEELQLAFDDISSHGLSYLSPHSIINQKNSLRVDTDMVIRMSEVKEFLREATANNNRTINLLQNNRRNSSILNNVNFSISIPKLIIPVQEQEDELLIESQKYLNEVSYFVRYDEDIELCPTEEKDSDESSPYMLVENDMAEALSNPVCRSLLQYDFLEDDNRLAAALRSGKMENNAEMLRLMPVHIKVLFASQSSKARNNYAESGLNYLCMPETRYYIETNHFTINQIEYLSGYGVNSDGEVNIKVPKWSLLTEQVLAAANSPLICRSRRYENPVIGLNESCTLDIPTAHKFFIISDTDTTTKPGKDIGQASESLVSAAQNALDESTLYSTSNIVSQPANKNSLIKGAASATATIADVAATTLPSANAAIQRTITTTTGRGY